MSKNKYIYIACPWTPKGGGMFKVADYLIQSQNQKPAAGDTVLEPLDTRGGYSAFYSGFVILGAIAKLFAGKITGKLAGVHVNMAERLSLFRKGIIIATCRLLGIPVVLHLHAAQLHHFYRALPPALQALTRWFFAISSHCIVLGNAARSFVINDLKLAPEKTKIVINGVPPPTVARRVRTENSPYVIYFLGNLSERKGVSDLLHAMQVAKFDENKVQLCLAGGGDIEGYQALAEKLGISKQVRFEGWADQAKASQLMSQADVLILPSYDEGLPLVILEALANGVAVICTPVGEIPTALHDGEDSCFVNPGDIPGIAAGMHKVIDDDAFRTHLERNGQAIYQREFSMAQFFANISESHREHFGSCAKPNTNSN